MSSSQYIHEIPFPMINPPKKQGMENPSDRPEQGLPLARGGVYSANLTNQIPRRPQTVWETWEPPQIFGGYTTLASNETNVGIVAQQLERLTVMIAQLQQEIEALKNTRTYVVSLTTLDPGRYRPTGVIPVTLQSDEDEFIASFTEANVSASGETEGDAIANLKESLISSYEVFANLRPDQMGPLPTRQWKVLSHAIERVG